MEKIYMEEESQKQQKQQKKSVVDFSVVLSFVVAFFAILSFVSIGIGNIQGESVSYAAPNTSGFTGGSFTMYRQSGMPYIHGKKEGGCTGAGCEGDYFSVPMMFSDENKTNPVFCVEKGITNIPTAPSDSTTGSTNIGFNKGKPIEDYGLLYILNNSLVNGKSVLTGISTLENDQGANIWATQVAIWIYLSETKSNVSPHTISQEELTAIQNAKIFVGPNGTVTGDGAYTKIRALVDAAKTQSSKKNLTISKAEGEISKSSDGKVYQSTLFSVIGEPSSTFKSYDVSLSGIDGAYIVDSEGHDLALTGIDVDKQFFVRIPADKVTQAKQNLKVTVTGHFDSLAGSYYVAQDSTEASPRQEIVSVTGAVNDVSEGVSIEVVGTPDTGMNSVQTIYFIGLIVLLCGIGIVYANAKPVQVKQ